MTHAYGAPSLQVRDGKPEGYQTNERGERIRDDYSRLFLGTSPIPPHLPETASNGKQISERRLDLLSRLAEKMAAPAVGVDTDNPDIPAGYTYLAQFVAHDLTFNLTPFDEAKGPARSRRNARQGRLVLQTLYGGGPTVNPYLYNTPEVGRSDRGTLRLGQVRQRTSAFPQAGDQWIDVPRVRVDTNHNGTCPYSLDGNVQRSSLIGNRHETLPADSRNDDNVIVSQITVLFSILHNAIYNRLDEPSVRAALLPHFQEDRMQFRVARDVVTLTYRRIIANDLLKRLLDPEVYAYFVQHGPMEPDPTSDRGIPLEFSHAAYRVGHAMIRPFYEMNDGVDADARNLLTLYDSLALGSQRLSQDLPLVKDWYAQWSKFFETANGTPQPSRRIGPHIVSLLGKTYQFPNEDGPDGASLPGGLVYRDLVRAEEEGLLTPYALAGHLSAIKGAKFDAEAYVKDIREKLVGWLSASGFAPEDIMELAGAPPLTLFILIEAWSGPAEGRKLGPIGSLVLGEVFFRNLGESEDVYEKDHHLQQAATTAFGGAAPSSMTELIKLIADWSPLEYRPLPIV